MTAAARLTATSLLAAAERALLDGGYRRVAESVLTAWPRDSVRVYEDPYCVAAVAVYETWAELSVGWVQLQEALVELISQFWSKSDAKAWDGYLVLLTPATPVNRLDAEAIRYNTSRVRKLLASGDDVRLLGDVTRVLAPLLPLEPVPASHEESALALLPRLLGQRGIEENAVRALIEAFEQQTPLVERLHARRTRT
jgi:hypothetical protein